MPPVGERGSYHRGLPQVLENYVALISKRDHRGRVMALFHHCPYGLCAFFSTVFARSPNGEIALADIAGDET